MEKLTEKKIEEMKIMENKVIEKIAETLVFISKEVYQRELKNRLNPNDNFSSDFYFSHKFYGRKNKRNPIRSNKS